MILLDQLQMVFLCIFAVAVTLIGSVKSCGNPAIPPDVGSRLVPNLIAVPHSWPWQVQLQFRNPKNASLWSAECGGSIITPYHIATAASCFTWDAKNTNWRVLIGAHNVSNDHSIVKVSAITIHESYSILSRPYDIAIVALAEPIKLSAYANAVCIPEEDFNPGTKCYTTGWKLDKAGDNHQSEVLLQATVSIFPSHLCRRSYSALQKESMICTDRIETSDPWIGYDGSPFVCQNDKGLWELQGIGSFVDRPEPRKQLGIHTRVAHFAKWIKERIQ